MNVVATGQPCGNPRGGKDVQNRHRRKVQKKKAQPTRKTARPAAKAARPARDRVITFRLSADEAGLIARAADRVPLARYSRDAVLARAKSDAKK